MWSQRFSLSVLAPSSAILSVCLAGALAVPAYAANPAFAPRVDSDVDNGAGPGPAPRGTATADFDNDGNADLVTIGNFTFGDAVVTFGAGDGTFGGDVTVSGTSQSQGLDAGDVNGDGDADVVAMTVSEVRVKLGQGDGTFTDGGTFPLTLGGQVHPLLADLDGDGDLDIVAPTFTAIQTLINDGAGDFTSGPTSQVSGAAVLSAITIADLNGDAAADLFTVDGFSGTTYALRGQGNGGFSVSGRLFASGFVPEDVAALDLDGDGRDDVATVGSFSFSLATARTNGNGAFRRSFGTLQFGGPGPTSASVADFNADGRDDLVVSSLANPAQGTLTVLAGNGTERMQSVGTLATAPFPQNPVLADYDNDGDVDIVTVSPGTASFLANTTP